MGFFPEDQYDYSQDYPQLGTKHVHLLEKNYELDLPIDIKEVDKISAEILKMIERNNKIPAYPCNGNARVVIGLRASFEYETVVSWGEDNTTSPYKSKRTKFNEYKPEKEPQKRDPILETYNKMMEN